MKNKRSKLELIGHVGVDSGQLMLCDPCYINSEWRKNEYGDDVGPGDFSYAGICSGTSQHEPVQLDYRAGHHGVGVAFPSGYGDGFYPVYAKRDKEGRIIEVTVKMG